METFRVRLPCEVPQLRGLRQELAEWTEAFGLPERTREAVILATHEAAASAIRRSCVSVEVLATVHDETVTVVVSDEGRRSANGPYERREGLGLSLIRAVTDDLEIRPHDTGATVRMVHRLRNPA